MRRCRQSRRQLQFLLQCNICTPRCLLEVPLHWELTMISGRHAAHAKPKEKSHFSRPRALQRKETAELVVQLQSRLLFIMFCWSWHIVNVSGPCSACHVSTHSFSKHPTQTRTMNNSIQNPFHHKTSESLKNCCAQNRFHRKCQILLTHRIESTTEQHRQ